MPRVARSPSLARRRALPLPRRTAPQRGAGDTSGPVAVAVAVAANLKPAFEGIAARFQAKHPGVEVKASFGASGAFFSQSRTAPFDLFLSADKDPGQGGGAGLRRRQGVAPYAYGRLVVWVPNASTLNLERDGVVLVLAVTPVLRTLRCQR